MRAQTTQQSFKCCILLLISRWKQHGVKGCATGQETLTRNSPWWDSSSELEFSLIAFKYLTDVHKTELHDSLHCSQPESYCFHSENREVFFVLFFLNLISSKTCVEMWSLHCIAHDMTGETCLSLVLPGSLLYSDFPISDVGGFVGSWTVFTRSNGWRCFLLVSWPHKVGGPSSK